MDNSFKVKLGLNLGSQAADPANPVEGDFYTNSVSHVVRVYLNGGWHDLDTVDQAQTLTNKTAAVASNHITGSVGKAAQFNASTGDLEAAATTSTELGYVAGVTSAIQTQLNGKQASGSYITALTGDVSASGPGSAAATISGLARSKLAAGTLNHVIINDGAGVLSSEATLAKSRGGSGQDNSSLTFPGSGTLATQAGTETFTNKTWGDAETLTQISTPASPASGKNKLYVKSDGNLYTLDSSGNEKRVGSGASGNINFLNLSTTWAVASNTDNSDFEFGLGSWARYKSGTGTAPTGEPRAGTLSGNMTMARTTTAGEILNGTASLKVTKGAFNVQGEGISTILNVPVAYQGGMATITIPYKILSGTVVQGDLKVYIYDFTNSQLITPFNNDIVGSNGTIVATFPVTSAAATPANIQLELAIHFASSSASALTFVIDDVAVTPGVAAMGMAGSDWQSYPLTIGATITPPTKGTTSIDLAQWRRVGDSMEIRYQLVQTGAGTAGSGSYLFPLPSGYSIDTAKLNVSSTPSNVVGRAKWSNSAGALAATTIYGEVFPYNSTNLAFDMNDASGANLQAAGFILGSSQGLNNANTIYTFEARVPIAGWSSNVTMANSSTYRISSFLANGTRVTGSAPTALGQYRSYLRNSSAFTYTETNGNPTTVPTSSDGIRLYQGATWATADTSNQPTRYEVYVGKAKNVKFEFYGAAGKTGFANCSPFYNPTNTSDYGYATHYDPVTGIATITANRLGAASSTGTIYGKDANGTDLTVAYADIIVSENALAVGVQAPRSSIRLSSRAGYGSTNTTTGRYSTSSITGTAFTYTSSATLGDSILINEDGVYMCEATDFFNSGGAQFGVGLTVNGDVTVELQSVNNDGKRICAAGSQTSAAVNLMIFSASGPAILKAGDVVRAQFMNPAGNAATGTDMTTHIRLVKVSN